MEHLGAEKLNRAWLHSDEGLRVVLALGEASLDLLRRDKVGVLAGAAVASSADNVPWDEHEIRFARLIVAAEYEVLVALWVLACDFGETTDGLNLKIAKYAQELEGRASGSELPHHLLSRVDEYTLRDALAALAAYRLADVTSESVRGPALPAIVTILPRNTWPAFAAYLRAAFVLSETGARRRAPLNYP